MMTVLYILDYGTVGGATKAFQWLIEEMKLLGVTPIVVTGGYNDFNRLLESQGVKTIAAGHFTAIDTFSFKSKKWPYILLKKWLRYHIKERLALRKLGRMVDFDRVNLIHTNSARNTLGCRLSKIYAIPHIVHIREFGDKDFGCIRLTPNYIRILNEGTDLFLSVSHSVQEYWNGRGINSEKNRLLYDGVRYEDITVSSSESKRNSVIRMVINGEVCTPKGQHLAVEAIGLLPESIRKNILLNIVGWYDRKYVSHLKSYAKDRGYLDKIQFFGSREDVHERMGEYQIGLMCSRSEGFGLVTVEYMHGQLGVIASDSGACPELVTDGQTGLIFKSGDSKDLARCIERLYNDRNLLIKISEAAKREAVKRFTSSINATNIFEMYKLLLENKN